MRFTLSHPSVQTALHVASTWTRMSSTLVVSEWLQGRSEYLIKTLDKHDHPFSEVVIMVPPIIGIDTVYHTKICDAFYRNGERKTERREKTSIRTRYHGLHIERK